MGPTRVSSGNAFEPSAWLDVTAVCPSVVSSFFSICFTIVLEFGVVLVLEPEPVLSMASSATSMLLLFLLHVFAAFFVCTTRNSSSRWRYRFVHSSMA